MISTMNVVSLEETFQFDSVFNFLLLKRKDFIKPRDRLHDVFKQLFLT